MEVRTNLRETVCVSCDSLLVYPENFEFLACPQCKVIFSPSEPYRCFAVCLGCKTLLEHRPNCFHMKCPKCFAIMKHPIGDEVIQHRQGVEPSNRGEKKESVPLRYARCLKCNQFLNFPATASVIQCPSEDCLTAMGVDGWTLTLSK